MGIHLPGAADVKSPHQCRRIGPNPCEKEKGNWIFHAAQLEDSRKNPKNVTRRAGQWARRGRSPGQAHERPDPAASRGGRIKNSLGLSRPLEFSKTSSQKKSPSGLSKPGLVRDVNVRHRLMNGGPSERVRFTGSAERVGKNLPAGRNQKPVLGFASESR